MSFIPTVREEASGAHSFLVCARSIILVCGTLDGFENRTNIPFDDGKSTFFHPLTAVTLGGVSKLFFPK